MPPIVQRGSGVFALGAVRRSVARWPRACRPCGLCTVAPGLSALLRMSALLPPPLAAHSPLLFSAPVAVARGPSRRPPIAPPPIAQLASVVVVCVCHAPATASCRAAAPAASCHAPAAAAKPPSRSLSAGIASVGVRCSPSVRARFRHRNWIRRWFRSRVPCPCTFLAPPGVPPGTVRTPRRASDVRSGGGPRVRPWLLPSIRLPLPPLRRPLLPALPLVRPGEHSLTLGL